MKFDASRRQICIGLTVCFLLHVANTAFREGEAAEPGSAISHYPQVSLRDKFVEARQGIERGRIARKLLAESNPDVLQVLRMDEDDGVAILAAWHRLELQMTARLVSVDGSAEVVHVPDALTREFLAFVEGRLRVPPPDEWARVVRASRFIRSQRALFPVLMRAIKLRVGNEGADGAVDVVRDLEQGRVTAPRVELDLEADRPMLLFSGGSRFEGDDENIGVTEKIQSMLVESKVQQRPRHLTGIAVHGKAVLAIQNTHGPSDGDIICIETTRGQKPKILWSKKTDSYWSDQFKGTEWFTELRTNAGNVYLFHATHDSIGIEALRLADGERLFSFNSRLPELSE